MSPQRYHQMNAFRAYGHQVYTEQIIKTALSRNDDKCFILDDQMYTRTIGHYLNKSSILYYMQ